MEPRVALLSHTAYPLETLYVSDSLLTNPGIPIQKPEEIRMLLYTELSQHLKSEHKQFILDKMKELIIDDNELGAGIKFTFFIENITPKIWDKFCSLFVDLTGSLEEANQYPTNMIWQPSLTELYQAYGKLEGVEKKIVSDACNEILEKVDPYLYKLLTEE